MPLTFTPDESEERKRRQAAALAAGGDKAINFGMDALVRMEDMARKDKATARQEGLDERAQTTSDRDFMRLSAKDEADRTRQTAQDKIAAEDRMRLVARQDATDETAADEREMRLQDAREKQRQADLPRVAQQLVGGTRTVDDELIDDMARQNGLDRNALEAAYRAEARARTEKANATALDTRMTESQIAENEAQAKRALRPPAGARPKTPEEIARQNVKDEMARVSLANAKNKGQGGLTTATKTDTEKKKIAIGLVRSEAGALRSALADPMIAGYTGPLSGLENHILTKFGAQNPKAIRLSSLVGQFFDSYKVAVTGAAATDAEMATLMTRMPNIDDTIPSMLAKLDAGETLASARMSYYDSVLAPPAAAPNLADIDEADLDNLTIEQREAMLAAALAEGGG